MAPWTKAAMAVVLSEVAQRGAAEQIARLPLVVAVGKSEVFGEPENVIVTSLTSDHGKQDLGQCSVAWSKTELEQLPGLEITLECSEYAWIACGVGSKWENSQVVLAVPGHDVGAFRIDAQTMEDLEELYLGPASVTSASFQRGKSRLQFSSALIGETALIRPIGAVPLFNVPSKLASTSQHRRRLQARRSSGSPTSLPTRSGQTASPNSPSQSVSFTPSPTNVGQTRSPNSPSQSGSSTRAPTRPGQTASPNSPSQSGSFTPSPTNVGQTRSPNSPSQPGSSTQSPVGPEQTRSPNSPTLAPSLTPSPTNVGQTRSPNSPSQPGSSTQAPTRPGQTRSPNSPTRSPTGDGKTTQVPTPQLTLSPAQLSDNQNVDKAGTRQDGTLYAGAALGFVAVASISAIAVVARKRAKENQNVPMAIAVNKGIPEL